MSTDTLSRDEVPTYTETSELNEIWEGAKQREEPAIAVGTVDNDGYVAKYDFHHLSIQLTEEATEEIQEIFDQKSEALLSHPDVEDGIGISVGQSSGRIFPIPEDEALAIASRISGIVLDSGNWEEYPNPFK